MIRRPWLVAGLLVLVSGAGLRVWTQHLSATSLDLPSRLSNEEFWQLSESFSESDGFFQSDNLVSNEDSFQHVIPELTRVVPPGGVYVGVGPDQNFTYIAALRPRVVFITDIRRGNLLAHLMYKALFELSEDRAEFLSRLFSRPRPDGLGPAATARELFAAYAGVRQSQTMRGETWRAIEDHLTVTRGFALTERDLSGVEYVFNSFYVSGPYLAYSNRSRRGRPYPTYQQLQMASDLEGRSHAYLASEDAYRFIRSLQINNLIVPVVGDFAGPKALRAVGDWIRERGAHVTTFYTSNVEQYLFQNRVWDVFAANVSGMPLNETSTFIRSCFNTCASPFGTRSVSLLDSMSGLMRDFAAGKIQSYWAVLNHTR